MFSKKNLSSPRKLPIWEYGRVGFFLVLGKKVPDPPFTSILLNGTFSK